MPTMHGIDTSWIWDADFEQITDMDIPEINAGGVRHSEISLVASEWLAIQLRKSLKRVIWSKFSRPLRIKTASMPIFWQIILPWEFRELLASVQIVRKEMN